MRWKAQLRGNRAQNLETLLRHEDLTDAFDALLDIPGLWDGMMFTTLHKMMAIQCDELGKATIQMATADFICLTGNLTIPRPHQADLVTSG